VGEGVKYRIRFLADAVVAGIEALPDAPARVDWARPTVKFDSGKQVLEHSDMVANWWKFGFVVEAGEVFVETERASQIP